MPNLINTVLQSCKIADEYHPQRTRNSIYNHMMSEIGELGIEINIVEGQSYKTPGADGIVGESIDVILSAIDFIYIDNPAVTSQDILRAWSDQIMFEDHDTRNSLFCHLCGRAGIVGGRINQKSWANPRGARVNQDAAAVVYGAWMIIHHERHGITEQELLSIALPKLDKWIQSIKKHAAK